MEGHRTVNDEPIPQEIKREKKITVELAHHSPKVAKIPFIQSFQSKDHSERSLVCLQLHDLKIRTVSEVIKYHIASSPFFLITYSNPFPLP